MELRYSKMRISRFESHYCNDDISLNISSSLSVIDTEVMNQLETVDIKAETLIEMNRCVILLTDGWIHHYRSWSRACASSARC